MTVLLKSVGVNEKIESVQQDLSGNGLNFHIFSNVQYSGEAQMNAK